MPPIGSQRIWCAAAALLASMLACGGRASSESDAPEPFAGASRPVPASSPSASSMRAAPPSATPVPLPSAPLQPRPPEPPRRDDECNCAIGAVENVLLANCGQCHGPSRPGPGLGGINFIGDVDELVERGLIVPLDSASSRIIVVMRDGSMPPSNSGLPAVTEADIETVVSYIDQPRFWPDVIPSAAPDAGAAAPPRDAGSDGG